MCKFFTSATRRTRRLPRNEYDGDGQSAERAVLTAANRSDQMNLLRAGITIGQQLRQRGTEAGAIVAVRESRPLVG
jgi:hypothetical protein